MQDVADAGVEQFAIVADDQHGMRIAPEIIVEPESALEIEIVGRLVEQQEVRLREQDGGERHAHAPAAREGRAGPVLCLGVEAEAMQDGGGAGRRRIGADIGQPRLDLGAAEAVRGLGLGEKGGAFLVGCEHHLDQAFGPARRFLRHCADPQSAGQGDVAALRGDLTLDDAEERRLAGPVAAHEPDLATGRQGEGRTIEQNAVADAVGEVVDVQHGRLLTREGAYGKARQWSRAADGGVEPEK